MKIYAEYQSHADYMKDWRKRNPGHSKKRYARSQGRENSRKLWTDAEDRELLSGELSDWALAKKLGRSEQAIHMRRHKITRDH